MSDPTFAGRLHDGVSARTQFVDVRLTDAACVVLAPDGARELAYADLQLLDAGADEVRLGLSGAPEFRLILPAAARPLLAARGGVGLDGRRARTRMIALVGGLVAASALLVAGLFFGAPMAAEPLARMTPHDAERAIGRNVAVQVETAMRACSGSQTAAAERAASVLADRFAAAAGAQRPVQVSFVRARAPNAIALPGGRIIVTRGLLETLDGGDEFAAVIAHEVSHVAARDGLIAVYRHAGLGLALEIITGGSGVAQQIVLLSGQLTELRYTRAQEQRADESALDVLERLGHDPAALGRALERIRGKGGGAPSSLEIPEWIESHPDIGRRIKAAEARARSGATAALSPAEWETIRAACATAQ